MVSPRLLLPIFATLILSACSSLVAPPYSADFEALDRLKKQSLQKVAVETVQPVNPDAPVNRISLRAASMVGPKGSFAKYLEDALVQDLQEISLYDATAGLRIEATLLKNEIDISGFSTGAGRMEAELSVKRAAGLVYKKTYSAATQFESSFAGNVAIPRGQIEYSNLVRALLGQVYADPDFINALKK